VQTIQSVGDGAQLKYTMAYYHLPSGQRVEGRSEMEKAGRKDWGVAPDVDVEMTTEELRKMIEVQRDNDVLVKATHKGEPAKKFSITETLAADPQLAIADLVIKSKLIQAKTMAVK
jgi:C-terminal processing protease CtpA/Prc